MCRICWLLQYSVWNTFGENETQGAYHYIPPWVLTSLVGLLSFPGGSDGKASAYNAGDLGLIPGSGRSPGWRKCQPTPVCLPGKSHGWSSLAGYSPWGLKESEMTELLHFHFSWYIFKIKLKKIQYYAAIVNDACEDKLFMLNEKASITVIFRNPINYKYASVCPVKKKRLERNSTAECQEIL